MPGLRSGKSVCAVVLLCTAAAISAPAQTVTILGSVGDSNLGPSGFGPLVQAFDGNLYGTTTANSEGLSYGSVFQLTTSGATKTLFTFNANNGQEPNNGLIVAPNGNLYGTTAGSDSGSSPGTVFEITTAGHFATLHAFCSESDCADGEYPQAGLVLANNGLWGATEGGGSSLSGTIFNITPANVFQAIFSFDGSNGQMPVSALVQGIDNNFYGTTQAGGANGYGTIFEITKTGVLTTLHNFTNLDGSSPMQLVLGPKGVLYGTANMGSRNGTSPFHCDGGCGVVFSISPGGHTYTILHHFNGPDGYQPVGLVLGSDGNLYGVTLLGGSGGPRAGEGSGTIFQLTPNGTFTTLYSFCSQSACADGQYPLGLMQATDGNFYGTTNLGYPVTSESFAFRLSTGLSPFVTTIPISSSVGRTVTILGTNLTGATSVTFNGTSSPFTVVSATEITTTVPAGATTGTVQVVTPNGTLSSNIAFRLP
jgi:uncharacterized repeat protein (TIGR03803 family)